jgi:hypothetical protein
VHDELKAKSLPWLYEAAQRSRSKLLNAKIKVLRRVRTMFVYHMFFTGDDVMKKLSMLFFLAISAIAGNSRADLVFSTSNTNALAGSTLSLELGQTGFLHTWVSSNAPGNRIIGVGFSVAESSPAVINALSHVVENPAGRWIAANPGALNVGSNLINDSASAGVPGSGILTAGPADFVLHSTFQVTALAGGQSILTFVPHSNPGNGIQIQGITGNQWNNTPKGTALVSVIPEPSSMLLWIAGVAGASLMRRRH